MYLTQKDLIKKTKCYLPCKYRIYSFVHENSLSSYGFGFDLNFGEMQENVEIEVFAYDFVSLISEFGGSLGLFTGFSFFMLWDMIIMFAFRTIKMFQ